MTSLTTKSYLPSLLRYPSHRIDQGATVASPTLLHMDDAIPFHERAQTRRLSGTIPLYNSKINNKRNSRKGVAKVRYRISLEGMI